MICVCRWGIVLCLVLSAIELPQVRVRAQDSDDSLVNERFELLSYLDTDGKRKTIDSAEDWEKRRHQILDAMQSIMGSMPAHDESRPVEVRVAEIVDCGTYDRRLIYYRSETTGEVPAYLCLPKSCKRENSPPVPAMLCLHPTDNRVGHQVVVGIAGKPNRQYAAELAERGYVTLSPAYPLLANYQPNLDNGSWASGTLKAVWDNRRGIDYLCSLDFVDDDRIGVIGHSLGGHNALFTAAFDERLKVVVTSCGFDSFVDYYGGSPDVWQVERGWCQTRYMPRLLEFKNRLDEIPFDFPEVLATIAPRKVLVVAPLRDSNFKYESVERVRKAAAPVFHLWDKPESLEVQHPDCDHDFPKHMREHAYRAIDDVLRPMVE